MAKQQAYYLHGMERSGSGKWINLFSLKATAAVKRSRVSFVGSDIVMLVVRCAHRVKEV